MAGPTRLCWMTLMVAAMIAPTGCNIFGAFHYATVGPPVQTAQYKPDQRPMAVLVENYQSPSAVAVDADRLASMVARELAENQAATLVDPEKVFALREQRGSAFAEMRISEIGQAVGAGQVLYIELLASRAEQPTGALVKATMSARVKVVDAETGRTLWPADLGEGQAIEYDAPMRPREENVSLAAVREEMLRTMARRTARLFYDWKPRDGKEAAAG